jgi:hypothetical protein
MEKRQDTLPTTPLNIILEVLANTVGQKKKKKRNKKCYDFALFDPPKDRVLEVWSSRGGESLRGGA